MSRIPMTGFTTGPPEMPGEMDLYGEDFGASVQRVADSFRHEGQRVDRGVEYLTSGFPTEREATP